MSCDSKYTGRSVILELADNDCTSMPAENDFYKVGAINTKSFTLGAGEIDTTADDNLDNTSSSITSYTTLEVTADGKARSVDDTISNHAKVVVDFVNSQNAGLSPKKWVRLVFPDITFVIWCLVTDPCSRSGSDTDAVTFSFAAKATSRNIGPASPAINVSVTPQV
ncbi:MAG: hypothetical protein COA43_14740 [Robiginitomaculum sp.]|nr:MAG: hypothetical protein COA43_14740 [Robiginitomaculum sp.]